MFLLLSCVFKIPVVMQGDAQVLIHNTFLIKASVLCIGKENLSGLGEVGFCCCARLHVFQCSVKLLLTVAIGNCYLIARNFLQLVGRNT